MDITLPVTVKKLLTVLEQAGYQTYVVGGAVRDFLLGKVPGDYDIATSAKPEQVVELAYEQGWRVIDKLGHNFGVVMVVVEGQKFEVATFRGERYGEDSHRPEAVWYADTLEMDLARRDFTVNAMAVSLSGAVIDPFGGQIDLARRVVRAVGNPHQRFQEDALRMFRACRFAGQLGFDLDEQTRDAISAKLERVRGLSLERVRSELEKMLLAPHCRLSLNCFVVTGLSECCCRIKDNGEYHVVAILPELSHLVDLPQNPFFHKYDGWRHTLATVENVTSNLTLRWAALLHDIAKGLPGIRAERDNQPTDHGHDRAGEHIADKVLARFQMPTKFRQRVCWLVARHMRFYVYLNGNWQSAVRWLREEARSGVFRNRTELQEAFAQLTKLCAADIKAAGHNGVAVQDALAFGDYLDKLTYTMPVHTSDLPCRMEELLSALDGQHTRMGPFLKIALSRVQDGNLACTHEAILKAASKWVSRNKVDSE